MNTLPVDLTPNRIMMGVHYYAPWQFCGLTEDASWGNMFYYWGKDNYSTVDVSSNFNWGEQDYVIPEFQKMKTKFIDKEIRQPETVTVIVI
jgi:hypothetical protein